MELHQLRYFVAVADEGNFSRAAAKVRVAQPSLSQQIRKLEAEIGQPLFDRLPRSVVLTDAGRCLLDYARQILASIGDARRCVDELKGRVGGDIPKALSGRDTAHCRGCDCGNCSTDRVRRAGCRGGVYLSEKSDSPHRAYCQGTVACARTGRTSSGEANPGQLRRS